MYARVDAPIIAGVLGLVAACISGFVAWNGMQQNRRTQIDLENFKAELERKKADDDARRDYEYEAKKRLYEVCEPLFFQLHEAAEGALHRIFSLARAARHGNLGQANGAWLSVEGYYLLSTIYLLLAPLALLKILRQNLTLVDLQLDRVAKTQYEHMKLLYKCWTDDFDLARTDPVLEYDPNHGDWRELRKQNESKHWRQGIPLGRLDGALDFMLQTSENGIPHLISFSEFENKYKSNQPDQNKGIKIVMDIFIGFHPQTRPVLWRVLQAQAYILKAITMTSRGTGEKLGLIVDILADDHEKLNWQKDIGAKNVECDAAVKEYIKLAYEKNASTLGGRTGNRHPMSQ